MNLKVVFFLYRRYGGFLGPAHCRVIARLLGYQGIALIIDELLKIVKELVRENQRNMVCQRFKCCYNIIPCS